MRAEEVSAFLELEVEEMKEPNKTSRKLEEDKTERKLLRKMFKRLKGVLSADTLFGYS